MKTLFVDLFAINAARNLIVPRGVVDLLTADPDLRVVHERFLPALPYVIPAPAEGALPLAERG